MTVTRCIHCNRNITFDGEYISKNGKFIPLDVDLTGVSVGKHQCLARQQEYDIWRQKNRKYKKCNKCGDDIYWDDRQKTDKGKWIPIDAQTAAPHLCVQR